MQLSPLVPDSLGKRKRSGEDYEDDEDDRLFVPEDNEYSIYETDLGNGDRDEQFDTGDRPYDESEEELPNCAAYDPRYLEIKERTSKLSVKGNVAVNSVPCYSMDVAKLRTRAVEISAVPEIRPSMIGLLGSAGAGKSSLLNSLVDIPDLAKALDSGESCTYVVFLYHTAPSTQTKRFSATIEYFGHETIGTMLASHVDDWKDWYQKDPEWTATIREQHYRRAMTCLATFTAIFHKIEIFSSEDAATATLNSLVEGSLDLEETLQFLVDLTRDMLQSKLKSGKHIDCFEADTQSRLHKRLDPLLTENSDPNEATLWPFVKTVSIGVRGSRVLDQHTIADLPGVSDTNQVRVKATYEQIEKCDEIWVVSPVGRVITDDVVDGLLQRYGKANRGRVAVVATMSDTNISHALAKDMDRRGYSLGNYAQLKKMCENMERDIDEEQSRKRKIRNKRSEEYWRLHMKIEDKRVELNLLQSQCDELIVRARNAHITKALQLHKRHHLPRGQSLNVFCVSDRHYAAHKKAVRLTGPVLSVEMTRIPQVRDYALGLAGPKMLQSLEDFIKHDFSVFYKGLDMWANQRWIEGRAKIRAIVTKPQQDIATTTQPLAPSVRALVDSTILTVVTNQHDAIEECALEVLQDLKGWHYATLKAFMMKDGCHHTTAMPQQSWNQRFTEKFRDIILHSWEDFFEAQEALMVRMEKDFVARVSGILPELKSEPATVALPMTAFEGALSGHIQGVRNAFRDCRAKLASELGSILRKATQDIKDESYFRAAMRDCYDECNADSGKGIKQRWLDSLDAHLTSAGNASPFAVSTNNMRAGVVNAAANQMYYLQIQLARMMHELAENVDLMISRQNQDRSEIPVRAAVKNYLADSSSEFEEIKIDLEQLKQAYRT